MIRFGDVLVEGTLRHVMVDLAKLDAHDPDPKATIPEWLRERLLPHLDEGHAGR